MAPAWNAFWNVDVAASDTLTPDTSCVAVSTTNFNVVAGVGAYVGDASSNDGAESTHASRYPAF